MTLIGNFEDIVQYNKDNKAFEGSTHDNVTIETLCDIMTKDSKDSDAAVPVASGLGKDRETIASDFLDNLEYGLEKLSQDVQGKKDKEHTNDLVAYAHLCILYFSIGLNTAEEISSTIGKFFESTIVKNLQLHQTTTSAPTSSPNAIPMIEENVKAKSNLQRLADVNAFILKMNGEKCLDISYANTVKAMKKEAFYPGEGLGTRQWVYQTCTEFGWWVYNQS